MRTKLFFTMSALLIFTVLAVSACNGLIPGTSPVPGNTQSPVDIYKAAAATATQLAVEAQIAQLQTQVAQGQVNPTAVKAEEATAVPPSETPLPTATFTPTATSTPLPTETPTSTPVPPTATPTATATNTPIPCNLARFVADVTYPDGSVVSPGQNFTKTWRLKNVGSCTWTTSYDLVYFNGKQMTDTSAVDFPGSVAPGQVIDLSVNLTAPSSEGTYRGNWKLRDASGVLFGINASTDPFFVVVKVQNLNANYPLDFAASYCTAEWTSGAGRLACPSPEKDSRGYVIQVSKPVLETGYVDDEAALITYPQMINDGVIRGKYPAYHVKSGDHFAAVIGCGRDKKSCDVNFQLDYQIGDGSIQTLKAWHEVYDEKFNTVDVDLSSLAGKDVKFILTVFANGSSTDDVAQWLAPRITH